MEGFTAQVIWMIESGRRRSERKLEISSFSGAPHRVFPVSVASNLGGFVLPEALDSIGRGGDTRLWPEVVAPYGAEGEEKGYGVGERERKKKQNLFVFFSFQFFDGRIEFFFLIFLTID